MRWLLVQAAWTALRTSPNVPMVLWARRMTERKQNRFVAVVALAPKIAGVMYALVRDKAKYQAHRASTARADDTPTVVAAGAAVTALARPSSSDTVRAEAGPDIPPRKPAKTRASAPTPTVGSAGWGMVGEEPPTSMLAARAASPRRRRTATGDRRGLCVAGGHLMAVAADGAGSGLSFAWGCESRPRAERHGGR